VEFEFQDHLLGGVSLFLPVFGCEVGELVCACFVACRELSQSMNGALLGFSTLSLDWLGLYTAPVCRICLCGSVRQGLSMCGGETLLFNLLCLGFVHMSVCESVLVLTNFHAGWLIASLSLKKAKTF
jgi:hypothetical protein